MLGNLGQEARLLLSKADLTLLHAAASARALRSAARRRRIGRVAGVNVRLVDGLLVSRQSASDQLVDPLRLVALGFPLLSAVDWWRGLPQPQVAEVSAARASRVRMAAARTLPFLFGGEGVTPKAGGFPTLYAPRAARGDAIANRSLQQRGEVIPRTKTLFLAPSPLLSRSLPTRLRPLDVRRSSTVGCCFLP